jgi:hypothetical protein
MQTMGDLSNGVPKDRLRKLKLAGEMARRGEWSSLLQKAQHRLAPVAASLGEPVVLGRSAIQHRYWQWQRQQRRMPVDFQQRPFVFDRANAARGQKKNVIWILLDALRQDIFDEYVRRGGFGELVSRGAYFSRAFAQGSWTYPSLFSFLTACYPFNCGVSKLLYEDGRLTSVGADFDEARPTLFSVLREHGYQVASILDGWGYTVRSTAGQEHREDRYFEDHWGWIYGQGRRFLSLEEQRDAILEYVAQAGPQSPFFLFVRSLYTHSPYRGIFRDAAYVTRMSQRGWRFRLVEGFIEGLRRFEAICLQPVLAALKATGQQENTAIVVCSDHGDMFWSLETDLRRQGPGEEAWRHELEPYQALTKVPLLISGTTLRGAHTERFRLMDVVPTLLDELGVAYDPRQFDGVSVHTPATRPLYADSAGHGYGGVAFTAGGPKLLMSERLGAVAYDIGDDEYERLEQRRDAGDQVGEVKTFVERASRAASFVTRRSDEALIRRLQALGYLE